MTSEKLARVLCINDSEITLFILKRALSKSNFTEKIIEKYNGQEALNYCLGLIQNDDDLENTYPRVIFLDLQMPVMNGYEFLQRFSTEVWHFFKETRIVISSQSLDTDETHLAKQYPFIVDFLKAPITLGYFTKLHEDLLEYHSFQGQD
jgi:CheY-like chemotaxis protein